MVLQMLGFKLNILDWLVRLHCIRKVYRIPIPGLSFRRITVSGYNRRWCYSEWCVSPLPQLKLFQLWI